MDVFIDGGACFVPEDTVFFIYSNTNEYIL